MSRPTFQTLTTALLTALVFTAPLACESGEGRPGHRESAPESAVSDPSAAQDTAAPSVDASAASLELASAPIIEDEPIFASGTAQAKSQAKPQASSTLTVEAPAQAPGAAATQARRPRAADSMRHPSLLPAGTPEANIVAFTRLPLSKRDGAPVAGAGLTGIHLDEIELGKDFAASRCEDPSRVFVAGADERVSVCFRVVHPREAETVTVEWARAGVMHHSIQVGVRDTHAYRTRAWMPVTEGRAGEWSATVLSEDGAVLGELDFEITR